MRKAIARSLLKSLLAIMLVGVPGWASAASAAEEGTAVGSDGAAQDLKVDPDTALLFEARIGRMRIGNGIRAFETGAGICLDFGDFTHALQLAITVDEDGKRASGWVFNEANRIVIDRVAGRVEYGSSYGPIKPGSFWRSRSGWCIVAEDLSRWIGIRLDPDLTNAVLAIESDTELPIEQSAKRAIAAERLRDLAADEGKVEELETLALPYRAWRVPSIDLSLQFGTTNDPLTGQSHSASYELFAAGEVAYFSSQARIVSDRRAMPQSLRLRFFREDASARLLGPAQATYLGLGDVESLSSPLVAQAAPGRGLAISNRPLGLSDSSDRTELVGDLPRGWDAELYRNGELIAATSGEDGRYEFRDIELHYGTNVLEVIRYGPQGQLRREKHLYNIVAQSPGAGEIWYSFGALQDRRDLVSWRGANRPGGDWRAAGQVEFGLGKGAALGVGLFHIPRAGETYRYGELTARAGLLGLLNEANFAAGADGGSSVRLRSIGQVAGSSVAFEGIINRGLSSERIAMDLRSNLRLAVNPRLKLAGQIVPLSFDLARVETVNDTQERARVRGAVTSRRFAIGVAAGWQRTHRPIGETLESGTLDVLFNTRMSGVRLRGEANWEVVPDLRFTGAQADAVFGVGKSGSGQVSIGYGARDGRFRYGLGYTRSFVPVALTASASGDDRGAFSLGLSLTLSMGPDGEGRFGRIGSESRAQTGTLLVRTFDDLNGDGTRQEGEGWQPLKSALVNGLPVEIEPSGVEGIGMIASLAPAVPLSIGLDTSNIADPTKVPTRRGVMVVPRAGVVMPVELGIVSTGTIEGTLADAEGPMAGYRLELIGLDGQDDLVTRSEFDGFFVFEGVRSGRYMLRMIDRAGPVELRQVETGADKNLIRLGQVGRPATLALGQRSTAPSIRAPSRAGQ